ncbi:MAG: hypothetical protein ACPLX7_04935 [Candidatus Kapaibacteriota bacterium]
MKLLFLVNGNAQNIFNAHNFEKEEFEILKIDEKSLATPKKLHKKLREKFEEVYFGCISIEFQRFIPFMFLYILFSKAKKGGIVDEEKNKIEFKLWRTILVTIPLLIFEFIASVFIVLFSYGYYFVWRKFKVKF